MAKVNYYENQSEIRSAALEAILTSEAPKKMVVAGPGTGKTFTFSEIFQKNKSSNNLALTFIKRLVDDMEQSLASVAEVRTFHSHCKMLLHKRFGNVALVPFLEEVIKEDADYVGNNLYEFQSAFQNLEEESSKIEYYLFRGNYYNAVSFDDAVYKVYRAVIQKDLELPTYDQIVIDEFQDFNSLEAAFIEQLERTSPVMIVGDDDQAVYSMRNSSPDFLRGKWTSGDYALFELPYCSRCPQAIVEATAAFIQAVKNTGGFNNRIDKPFYPYLEDKKTENKIYPRINVAMTANNAGISKYIEMAIKRIPEEEVKEAYENDYASALIIGSRKYLNPVHKKLRGVFPNVQFPKSHPKGYSLLDAYYYLRQEEDSNLGWRLLAKLELRAKERKAIVEQSHDGTPMRSLLPSSLIEKHLTILGILNEDEINAGNRKILVNLLGDKAQTVEIHFFPPEEEDEPDQDILSPLILFTSFEGSKGLSAGNVFVVGLNHGVMPKQEEDMTISDIEYSKFVVAMTRARKLLHLISNKFDFAPTYPGYSRSPFISMIPPQLLHDGGYLLSRNMEKFLNNEI